jgi:hypothetical protein
MRMKGHGPAMSLGTHEDLGREPTPAPTKRLVREAHRTIATGVLARTIDAEHSAM